MIVILATTPDLGVRRVIANCFLDYHTSLSPIDRVAMRRELHAVRESVEMREAPPRRGLVDDLSI